VDEVQIFSPTDYYGTIMDLVTKRRGIFKGQEYPAPNRVQLNFEIPLSELIVDFFDEDEIAHARLCLDGLPVP
jgi:GTP-binding protein LepA